MTFSPATAAAALLSSALLLTACGGADLDLAASADALTAEETAICSGLIDDLAGDTAAVVFKNPAKDRTGALVKLSEAQAKLAIGKLADAVRKLGDFEVKITALIAGNKIFPSADGAVTPDDLLAGAQAAADCILPPVSP